MQKKSVKNPLNGSRKIIKKGNFFLWLFYFDPHDPYNPPAEHRKELKTTNQNISFVKGDIRSYLNEIKAPTDESWKYVGYKLSEEETTYMHGLYEGEIKYMDYHMGRVLTKLKELNLDKNTLVILTSDHGELLGEDDLWNHCITLKDEVVKVPLMISVGGKKLGNNAKTRIPVSNIDIFPTVLDLLEIDHDFSNLKGVSLLELQEDRTLVLAGEDSWLVRQGDWKLVFDNNTAKLYNIVEGKKEQNNMFRVMPEISQNMMRFLNEFIESNQRLKEDNKKSIELLKSLGYLN